MFINTNTDQEKAIATRKQIEQLKKCLSAAQETCEVAFACFKKLECECAEAEQRCQRMQDALQQTISQRDQALVEKDEKTIAEATGALKAAEEALLKTHKDTELEYQAALKDKEKEKVQLASLAADSPMPACPGHDAVHQIEQLRNAAGVAVFNAKLRCMDLNKYERLQEAVAAAEAAVKQVNEVFSTKQEERKNAAERVTQAEQQHAKTKADLSNAYQILHPLAVELTARGGESALKELDLSPTSHQKALGAAQRLSLS